MEKSIALNRILVLIGNIALFVLKGLAGLMTIPLWLLILTEDTLYVFLIGPAIICIYCVFKWVNEKPAYDWEHKGLIIFCFSFVPPLLFTTLLVIGTPYFKARSKFDDKENENMEAFNKC